MAKRFLPTRWWEWVAVAGLVALLAAIFMPVYAYSGPGLNYGRVARELQYQHRERGNWPRTEADFALKRVPRHMSYSYRLQQTAKQTALYEIEVNGKAQQWLVRQEGKAKQIGGG